VRHILVPLITATLAVAVGAAEPAPRIQDFRLEGERWTCLADGKALAGVLVKPTGSGPFGGILISHGLGGSADRFALPKAREFARWGLVSIATDYTHSGRGGDRSTFGASAENIRRARTCLAILRALPEVDPRRLCAYGNSMGAFLTIGLAADHPSEIRAAAITAGGVSEGDGFPAPTAARAAGIRAPFLILHGSADTTVPPGRAEALKAALDRAGTPNEHHVFAGVGHGVFQERGAEVNRLLRAWFTKHGVIPAER
jgi:dienelactone hydrolase